MSRPGPDSRELGDVDATAGGRPTPVALPPPDTKRWVTRRKAEVVAAVAGGHLTREEACARYGLTDEEFASWQRLVEAHGVRGLRVTRLKDYRTATGGNDPATGSAAESPGDRRRPGSRTAPTHG